MNIVALFNALPGACAQGLIWGIMAIGVFITYKILDLADLTVDGTMCTGGAVCIVMMINGHSVGFSLFCAFVAGMLAGLATGIFHTAMGIPAILAGILTQLGLYSINLRIMGNKSNIAISTDKYDVLVSLRYIKNVAFYKNTLFVVAIVIVVLIGVLYWFFGTELGCSIRSTGSNQNMSRAQGINTDLTDHRPDAFQWHCGTFQRSSGAVSGLCRYQHGTWRHRYWSGSRHHRRSCIWKNLPKFCIQPFDGGTGLHHLLSGYAGCFVARLKLQ